VSRLGPKRPNPLKVWRERRRFRKLSAAPSRPPGRRPKRPGVRARVQARRSVRKAVALPKGPRPGAMARFRARRQIKHSQPAWATRPPKPKVPIKDRLSSALYRPKPLKVDRLGMRERMAARASMKTNGPQAMPKVPFFRGRNEKVIAAVAAGCASFVVLTWLVSRAPVPEGTQTVLSIARAPVAPEETIDLEDFTPPPPPKPKATPTDPVYVPTFAEPTDDYTPPDPPPTTPPTRTTPPHTTTPPVTTTPPTTTTPPVTTTPPTTTTPPVTTTPPTTTTPPPRPGKLVAAGLATHPVQSLAGVLLLLLVGAALARRRSTSD
jgi:hypothetical protein